MMGKSVTSKKRTSGFTLVELMITLSVIALLAVISMMFYRNQIYKGNDARRKADIDKIKIAVEEYEKDNNCYPAVGVVSCSPGTGLSPYLQNIPCDPTTKVSYRYVNDGTSCARWYKIYTVLQNIDDTALTPNIGPGSAYNFVLGSPNAP